MIRAFFILSILSLTFISCKKNYTCACEQTYTTTEYTENGTFYPETTTTNSFQNIYRAKENEASAFCKSDENINIQPYGDGESQRTVTETIECNLQ